MAQAPFEPYRGAEIAPDENAVVDTRLRLRGADGFRVVDA